jgi:hypothetical protein
MVPLILYDALGKIKQIDFIDRLYKLFFGR